MTLRLFPLNLTNLLKTILLVYIMMTLFTALGCVQKENGNKPETNFPIEKEYKRGPVEFRLKLSHQEITIADRIHLVLEAQSEEGYEVRLPELGAELEPFRIINYSSLPTRMNSDHTLLNRTEYELEPFLSGKYEIPPMKITFWKKDEENPKIHEIETERIFIEVKSLLPEKASALEIKEIVPPTDLPRSFSPGFYLLIAGVLLMAGVLSGYFYWWKKKKKALDAPKVPPHDIAYRELEVLLSEKLIEQGEIKTFYLRLSNILRDYIENRFSLRAPERTTEEFLLDLRSTDLLMVSQKDLLKAFLKHCDMVKFAKLHPSMQEIQKTFDSCKQLIEETKTLNNTHQVSQAA